MARTGTRTSDFGVSKREGHDSSRFYGSRLYEGITINEKHEIIDESGSLKEDLFHGIVPATSATMASIPANSIHLVVYQAPAFEEGVFESPGDYIEEQVSFLAHLKEMLVIGGRLVVIIDDEVGTRVSGTGYWPFHADIARGLMTAGLYMRGEVILRKRREPGAGKPAGWLASAYRHGLVFSNIVPRRVKKDAKAGIEKTDSITRDQFLEYTKSIWAVNGELMTGEFDPGHVDIEQIDYVSRFMHLYSFKEDVVMACLPGFTEGHEKAFRSVREKLILLEANSRSLPRW